MSTIDDAPSKLEVLQRSALLDSLPEEHLAEVAARAKLATVARGETIWLKGSNLPFFGVVASCFVKMMRSSASGQDVTTELMGPGQVFGLLGAIDGSGCPQTAQAVCDTLYLKVERSHFLTVYNTDTILKDRLLSRTTQRLRGSYDLFAIMSTGKVDQRIAAILLILSESYGDSSPNGTELQVPLTRQDIAEMAGTTVETCIRTLSQWQRTGLVTTQQQRVTICDTPSLKKLLS
ncbi:MAG TPA: Crp/Fnr family transcriptional regulator [Fimbriimonas sp.]|nr:Crp/Fnr family transcriptional regulator [Fimbriimonas sp.]